MVSSQLDPEYGPDNLHDGDAATAWRDGFLHGDGAVITFYFERPVTIFAVVVQGLEGDEDFHRSYRIRGFRLDPGKDGGPLEVEMPDTRDPFRIDLGGVTADQVTIEVLSTYPAEASGAGPPREELAVAEVEILGQAEG